MKRPNKTNRFSFFCVFFLSKGHLLEFYSMYQWLGHVQFQYAIAAIFTCRSTVSHFHNHLILYKYTKCRTNEAKLQNPGFSTDCSKTVLQLQFSFVLYLFVHHLYSFWCLRRAVLRNYCISWMSSLIFWHFLLGWYVLCYGFVLPDDFDPCFLEFLFQT